MRSGTARSLGIALALAALALAALALRWLTSPRDAGTPDPHEPQTQSRASVDAVDALDATSATTRPGAPGREPASAQREAVAAPAWSLEGRVLGALSLRLAEGRLLAYRAAPTDRALDPASFFREASLGTHPALANAGPRTARPSAERLLATAAVHEDGSFEFGELRARDLQLVLEHPYLALENECYVHVGTQVTRHALGLLRTRAGARVVGRVEPAPTANARLLLTAEIDPFEFVRNRGAMSAVLSGASSPEIEADAEGRFELRAVPPTPSSRVFLVHEILQGSTEAFPLVVGETREVVVRVRPGARVAVTVRDEGGAPIAAARVLATRSDVQGEIAEARSKKNALTDANGVATLAPLAPVAHELEVRANGFRSEQRPLTPTLEGESALSVTLSRGLSIAGIVVTADGAPIAGAKLAAEPALEIPFVGDLGALGGDVFANQAARGAKDRSGADGRFVLHGFEADATLTLVAAADGYLPGSQPKVRAGAQDVRIVLRRGGRIVGRIVGPESGPATARVETVVTFAMVMQRPTKSATVTLGAPGFELAAVPPGSATLRITADGLATLERAVQIEDEATLDVGTLELARAASVHGRVVTSDGAPVAGAMVQRKRGSVADNPILAAMLGESAVTTASDGSFAFHGLAPGKHTLSASAEGHASGKSARLELAAGQEVRDVEIRLTRGGTIQGKVELAAGEATSDFQVTVSTAGGATFGVAHCDSEGRFRIEHLDPGRYDVQAIDVVTMERASAKARRSMRPGKSPDLASVFEAIGERTLQAKCTVKDGETSEVVLDGRGLGKSGNSIAGRVTLGARPLDDGMLELAQLADGETATRRLVAIRGGKYEAHGLAEGSWRLQVHRGGTLAPVGDPRLVTISKGTPTTSCDLELPAGALRGTVRRAGENAGLAGALVRIVRAEAAHEDPMGSGFTMTDGRGAFAFEGLAAGTYDLVADDELFRTGKEGRAGRLEGIVLASGQVHEGLVLEARAAAGLVVEVTTPGGEGAAHATCLVVDPDGRALGITGSALTDERGVAHIAGVAAGRVRVLARDDRHAPAASAELQVVAGQETKVVLALGTGIPTSLRVEDADGKRIPGVQVALRRAGLPWAPHRLVVRGVDAQDGLDLGVLPPGPLELRIEHPQHGTRIVSRSVPEGTRARLVVGW